MILAYVKNIIKLTSLSKLAFFVIILITFLISLSEIISLGLFQSILISILDKNITINNNFLNFLRNIFLTKFEESYLSYLIIFFVFFYFLKNLVTVFFNFIFFRFIEKKHYLMNKKFLQILINIKYLDLLKNKNTFYSQILSRYIDNFIKNILGSLIRIFSESIFIFVVFVYLLTINFKIVVLVLFFLVSFIFIYNSTIKKYLKKNSEKISLAEENLKFNIYEYIKNYREIFLYKLNNIIFSNLDLISKNYVKYERRYLFVGSVTKYIFEIFIIFFLSFYILSTIDQNELTYDFSSIITISFALLKLLPSFNIINNGVIQINQHYYSIKIINEYFNSPQALLNQSIKIKKDNSNNKLERIVVKNITFSYDKKKNIFQNLSFQSKRGDIIHVEGISGSGKSTLLDLLSNIIQPNSGSINFYDQNNEKITNFNDFSYVGQNPNLFNATLKYNISLGNKYIDDKILMRMIQEVDMNLDTDLKNILDYEILEDGKNLSGGQKQKLSVIRTIAQNTQVILFDEITSGLDKASSDVILNLIYKIKKEKIIFFVSHKEDIKFDNKISLIN